MVLKKRKNSSDAVHLKVINNASNIKGPGVPLVPVENKISSTDYFMKNNNTTLNNGLPSPLKGNIDKHEIPKFMDLEAAVQSDSLEICTMKSWVDVYLSILSFKWFTVKIMS